MSKTGGNSPRDPGLLPPYPEPSILVKIVGFWSTMHSIREEKEGF